MKEPRGITINTKKSIPFVNFCNKKIFDGETGVYINKNTGDLIFIYFVDKEHFCDLEGNETAIKLYDMFIKDIEHPRAYIQHEKVRISYSENIEWFCSIEEIKTVAEVVKFNFGTPKNILPENYKGAFNA